MGDGAGTVGRNYCFPLFEGGPDARQFCSIDRVSGPLASRVDGEAGCFLRALPAGYAGPAPVRVAVLPSPVLTLMRLPSIYAMVFQSHSRGEGELPNLSLRILIGVGRGVGLAASESEGFP